MVNRGLGLDQCDTSKDEYFCVFCCKESGCNRDILTSSPHPLIIFTALSIAHLIRR
ncbi:hypothetical protein O3M35_010593 [Rhynocoris fuscipes]|uniref:Uncharacterized protein n=1 Tax=Rhynocoris fuscipes TaxID=488301 RepID=A0AAW1CZI7_9HEMI